MPQRWLHAVMSAESAGCEFMDGGPTTSPAGAMGLMQLMPATWWHMRVRLGLGNNPYDPHDNILAGAAYLRELYDRYGSPGFVAAYHAGPERYEAYREHRRPLPAETLDYLVRVQRFAGEEADPVTLSERTGKRAQGRPFVMLVRSPRNEATSSSQTIVSGPFVHLTHGARPLEQHVGKQTDVHDN